jgi:hypothetical protein
MRTKAKDKTKAKAKTKTQAKAKAAPPKSDFDAINKKLESILRKYERRGLKNTPNQMAGGFCLIGPETATSLGREVWFGAVGPRKNYVSYHLMPIYWFPDLLKGVSPELKKRMQGKSCFNFKEVDDKLFGELAALTEKCYQRFKSEKLIR